MFNWQSVHNRLCHSTSWLAALLLLTACAQQPFQPSSDAQLQKTATDALVRHIYLQTLTDTCALLSDDLEIESLTLLEDWLDLHWRQLDAADRYLSIRWQDTLHDHHGRPLSLHALQLAHEHQRRVLTQLNLQRRTPTNQAMTCNRELERFAADMEHLASEPWQVPYLLYLEQHYAPEGMHSIEALPRLGSGIELDIAPGRSFYTLEEQLKQDCQQPLLLTLYNQWPRETYGAFCSDNPVAFIQCEWGHCQQEVIE